MVPKEKTRTWLRLEECGCLCVSESENTSQQCDEVNKPLNLPFCDSIWSLYL